MNTFYSEIEKHLKKTGGLIAITQGKNKLQKKNSNVNKFNFNLKEVLELQPSIEEFIKALPKYGFSSGAILSLRKVHGSSTRLISEVTLKFEGDNVEQNQKQPLQLSAPINNALQKPLETMSDDHQQQPMPTKAMGMGFTQVPQSDLINLHLKSERYADILEKYNDAKTDRDDAKRELKKAKDEAYDLQRKLDTIEDKYEMKIERLLAENKKFFETETGKELIGVLGQILPTVVDKFAPSNGQAQAQPQPALSGGMPNLSQAKQQFIGVLSQASDEAIPVLQSVTHHLMNTDDFYDRLSELIQSFDNLNNA